MGNPSDNIKEKEKEEESESEEESQEDESKKGLSEKYVSKKCKELYDLMWDADRNVRRYERWDKIRDIFNKHVQIKNRVQMLTALSTYSNITYDERINEENLVETLACYSRAMVKEYRG